MAGLVPFNRNLLGGRTTGFEDFYNMLDDFFSDTRPGRSLLNDTFKVDVHENEKEYCIEAELPGIKKEEISLEIDDGKLTISVNREDAVQDEKKNYVHRERRFSSMKRGIYLKEAAPDNIKAKLEDGVLNIIIPKLVKNDKTMKIDIE
ncbi:small heat shock protein [hydrocarbon metagenome]|uniref:Small heat shock protein n=1 Tax=hydrocarbon metagenome TaxID=938273 RepID=A0A0W8E3D3_9ZZZZ